MNHAESQNAIIIISCSYMQANFQLAGLQSNLWLHSDKPSILGAEGAPRHPVPPVL